ncbi:TetR/AcrR family transcriptional regulator [Methylobacterium gnaphalii]|uniref:TetR family transcriptional regulator n=1 Tax=Methylobacterium gnaphalii TaxID=1010610 RepID=A0A512JEU1_9HYPH|nr:TetR/AcrR family transcriptional regulator [Methylobacterium gnaphalii]GEP08457.1 TetR family transcriptional regulator [Methylobacterium gnaphalii]GJD68831.1 putative HTH-type transcriptional regulator YxaF [Methylobacterium gnaphalii]GLS47355.1 TetR family transcriptional regulator [Methylobacterium gnaphalii]
MARTVKARADVLPALAEVFREYGYEGASLSLIGQRTELGKGSLYNFFPGGKEEMANAVLDEIDEWFETRMFKPLREEADASAAIRAMLADTLAYFRSGRRVCLIGALALGDARDRFAERINVYFAGWRDALATALARQGLDEAEAQPLAEDAVALIQGGLVAARAMDDPSLFERLLARLEMRLLPAPKN